MVAFDPAAARLGSGSGCRFQLLKRGARDDDLIRPSLIDDLELLDPGTLLDRLHRAEKRGWVDDSGKLVRIRELRNLIAHEYAAEKMADIYSAAAALAPELIAVVPKVIAYAGEPKKT